MEVFVKSFATYRTIKKATSISYAEVLDSLESDTSTVTVKGTGVNRSDTGNWLIMDGNLYQISNVKPENDRTVLTLTDPLEAFSRPLELDDASGYRTMGEFMAAMLQKHWIQADDPTYSMPYLQASDSGTASFVAPDLDNGGCFRLSEYCRLMRKSYRTVVQFMDSGKYLQCSIFTAPEVSRNIPFDDGRSQIQSVTYSSSGIAKLSVIHDVDTKEKDENGDKIYERERSTWYLSEDGEITQLIPARRASGGWDTLYIQGDKNVLEEVVKKFAKNQTSHKLEFWSDRDLSVQTDCTFMVYGELLRSHISYKRKDSERDQFYYKSGELATTATEKLRGVLK